MGVQIIEFYQAKCDNCGEILKYDSTQFTGNGWTLFPRLHGWYVGEFRYTPRHVLCPKCKDMKDGDTE